MLAIDDQGEQADIANPMSLKTVSQFQQRKSQGLLKSPMHDPYANKASYSIAANNQKKENLTKHSPIPNPRWKDHRKENATHKSTERDEFIKEELFGAKSNIKSFSTRPEPTNFPEVDFKFQNDMQSTQSKYLKQISQDKNTEN